MNLGIVGILLAAGASTRFGGDKLLHPGPGGVAIGVIAARNMLTALSQVFAVIRIDDDALAAALTAEGCQVVRCRHASRGMGASLACGVDAALDAEGWVVALGDMPWLPPAAIAAVAQALAAGKSLVAPIYDGQRGHPVGFGKRFGSQLLRLDNDLGAREVIAAHQDEMTLLTSADSGICRDVDLPADLERRDSR